MTSDRPHLPETPRDALGAIVPESVIVDERAFLIERPSESDKLLDHPALRAALEADDYLPYWADLWPAARMLAKWLIRQSWPAGLSAIEIGCGLGLPGVVACKQGIHVTFSDYDSTALHFAARNARLNGCTNFDTLQMDWRYPPADRKWPLVLASDLIYEVRNVEPLVKLVRQLLAPDGVCLLTDQDRIPAHVLKETLAKEGLPYTTQ